MWSRLLDHEHTTDWCWSYQKKLGLSSEIQHPDLRTWSETLDHWCDQWRKTDWITSPMNVERWCAPVSKVTGEELSWWRLCILQLLSFRFQGQSRVFDIIRTSAVVIQKKTPDPQKNTRFLWSPGPRRKISGQQNREYHHKIRYNNPSHKDTLTCTHSHSTFPPSCLREGAEPKPFPLLRSNNPSIVRERLCSAP